MPPTRKAVAAAAAGLRSPAANFAGDLLVAANSGRPEVVPAEPSNGSAFGTQLQKPGRYFKQSEQESRQNVSSAACEGELAALEDRLVNSVYNAIAPHFSATR